MKPYDIQKQTLQNIKLPDEIVIQLNDYLWGTTNDWKRKLDIHNQLPADKWLFLSDVPYYRSYSNLMESEDCLYCSCCGEKTLFFALSFYRNCCEECYERM